jgi:hypothetical protein
MPRFKATIEFNRASNDISLAEHYLRDKLYLGANIHISNLERLSITHEEAIAEIKKLIDEESTYGCADASKIKSILEKVI